MLFVGLSSPGWVDAEAFDDGLVVQDHDVEVVADDGHGRAGPRLAEQVVVAVAEFDAAEGVGGAFVHGRGCRQRARCGEGFVGGVVAFLRCLPADALVWSFGVEQHVVGVE